jgi:putative ABC transport system permease protein
VKDEHAKNIGNDGIYITAALADTLKIKAGESIKIQPSMSTSAKSVRVSGILRISSVQGLYLTKKSYEKLGFNFIPTAILTNKRAKTNSLVTQTISLSFQRNNGFQMVQNLSNIFLLIFAFGVILTLVISYNLGMLGFIERRRDYATLRVLGFKISEIRTLTMWETLVTTGVGVIVGLPFGYFFLTKYIEIFNNQQIFYYTFISMRSLLITVAITVTASLSVILLSNGRLKTLDMVESLKGVN